MIPTQPRVPWPSNPDNTWQPGNSQMWQCPFCQQMVGNMQYHQCSGIPIRPQRVDPQVGDIQFGGMISEFQMYGDFKKLLKRDTLVKFRERFIGELDGIARKTEEQGEQPVFGIDVVESVFDEIARRFHDDASL